MERFVNKVNKTRNCWEWTGASNKLGYGFSYDGEKTVLAHRRSWELYKREIPKGLFILHKCDNRKCVKPSHLFLGTQKANCQDALSKGRNTRGEMCQKSDLKTKDIRDIRALARKMTQTAIAKKYGVSISSINYIVRRMTWKHV